MSGWVLVSAGECWRVLTWLMICIIALHSTFVWHPYNNCDCSHATSLSCPPSQLSMPIATIHAKQRHFHSFGGHPRSNTSIALNHNAPWLRAVLQLFFRHYRGSHIWWETTVRYGNRRRTSSGSSWTANTGDWTQTYIDADITNGGGVQSPYSMDSLRLVFFSGFFPGFLDFLVFLFFSGFSFL